MTARRRITKTAIGARLQKRRKRITSGRSTATARWSDEDKKARAARKKRKEDYYKHEATLERLQRRGFR